MLGHKNEHCESFTYGCPTCKRERKKVYAEVEVDDKKLLDSPKTEETLGDDVETKYMKAMDFPGAEYIFVIEFNTAYHTLGKGFTSIRSRQIVENLLEKGRLAPILPNEIVTIVRSSPPGGKVIMFVRITE